MDKGSKTEQYCCSNPNCHKIFSKPKIIKHYVCPSCQTLIDLNAEKVQVRPVSQERHPVARKVLKRRQKQEPTMETKIQEIETAAPTFAHPETKDERQLDEKLQGNKAEQALSQSEMKVEPKLEEKYLLNEKLEVESANVKNFEPLELTLTQRLEAMVREKKKEEAPAPDSSSIGKCLHYLGYLKQRTKGEIIPEACIECSQSIECLLSEPDRSKESLKEIKKWYAIKLSH
jgi:hypothetical protein